MRSVLLPLRLLSSPEKRRLKIRHFYGEEVVLEKKIKRLKITVTVCSVIWHLVPSELTDQVSV